MTTEKARRLRRDLTDAEKTLWRILGNRSLASYKFRRRHVIGQYIVDFACVEKKLVIELDGGHHAVGAQSEYDQFRTAWLEAQGYRVLRFWNTQPLQEIDSVKEAILEALQG
ncbi:MAG: endonuclease domain-containing protein [SAR202 cluster bacterium]|nr:endonuclease domain-containing protein [SAR202 cluster bacterium]